MQIEEQFETSTGKIQLKFVTSSRNDKTDKVFKVHWLLTSTRNEIVFKRNWLHPLEMRKYSREIGYIH
jgi:hypothetical protein